MNRTEEFLELYKQLEEAAVSVYNFPEDGSAVRRLSGMKAFAGIKPELSFCREVRNLLQHRRKLSGQYAVEPSESMVQLLRRTLEKVKNPIILRDIAIPIKNALWTSPSDSVEKVMKSMGERGFTYVPILERGIVAGVFGQNTVFSYLLSHKEGITPELTFRDIREYTGLTGRGSEVFLFLKPGMLKTEAERLCESAYRSKKRVGLIFLTPGGLRNERVSAVLTPWDILGT